MVPISAIEVIEMAIELGLTSLLAFAGYKYLLISGRFCAFLFPSMAFFGSLSAWSTPPTAMYYLVAIGVSIAAVPVAWLLPVAGTFCIGALAGYFATAFALLFAGVGLLTAHVIGLIVAVPVGIACIGRRLPLIYASAYAGSRMLLAFLMILYFMIYPPTEANAVVSRDAGLTDVSYAMLFLNIGIFAAGLLVQLKWTAPPTAEESTPPLVETTAPQTIYKQI